jgi:hypothetical protein
MSLEMELERAWRHVGRFMWSFSIVEGFVDEVLVSMFSLNATGSLILLKSLDLGRKLTAIQIALERQGATEHVNTIKRVRKLSGIRNVIAHSAFTEDNDGLLFDYIGSKYNLSVPDERYTYTHLDSFHDEMNKLRDRLAVMPASFKPVAELDDYAIGEIAEEISDLRNVIQFPRRPREEHDQSPKA